MSNVSTSAHRTFLDLICESSAVSGFSLYAALDTFGYRRGDRVNVIGAKHMGYTTDDCVFVYRGPLDSAIDPDYPNKEWFGLYRWKFCTVPGGHTMTRPICVACGQNIDITEYDHL